MAPRVRVDRIFCTSSVEFMVAWIEDIQSLSSCRLPSWRCTALAALHRTRAALCTPLRHRAEHAVNA
eukprot:6192373-Pleurochrysis_carterae.AAC.2